MFSLVIRQFLGSIFCVPGCVCACDAMSVAKHLDFFPEINMNHSFKNFIKEIKENRKSNKKRC